MSSTDKIGKLYRNQGNLFAIDDTNDDETVENKEGKEHEFECVNLNVWLSKSDVLNKFKCFYKDKRDSKSEWIPGSVIYFRNYFLK